VIRPWTSSPNSQGNGTPPPSKPSAPRPNKTPTGNKDKQQKLYLGRNVQSGKRTKTTRDRELAQKTHLKKPECPEGTT